MDKELKMKLLEELMAEMDETSLSKFKKKDALMPDDGMVKVKEVKLDEVPAEKAPGMIKEKIMEAMKKDGMEDSEDDDVEMETMGGDDSDEEDEYEGSDLMKRLKALKKG